MRPIEGLKILDELRRLGLINPRQYKEIIISSEWRKKTEQLKLLLPRYEELFYEDAYEKKD